MMDKPADFNANGNYANKKAALRANNAWYKATKKYYKELYNSQIKDQNLTIEQRSHIFDHYQHNLSNLNTIYKQNIRNIKFHFADIKTKVAKNNATQKTILSKRANNEGF